MSAVKQQGMALLAVAILLLSIMGLIAFMSMKTVVSNQRITGNDLRSRQALDAADSGLAVATATAIYSAPSVETSLDVTTINAELNPVGDSYQVGTVVSMKICPPIMGNKYHIIAVGQSNDGKAQRTVERWIAVGASTTLSGYVMGSWRDFNVSTNC